MKEKLYIFDTTLRDGAQTYGVDFNVDEKKLLAQKLDELGVDYIEGCLLYTSPSPRDSDQSRMPSSA